MPEPVTSSSVAALSMTAGLAAIEMATGISPPLFAWGAIGGYWAFRYLPAMTLLERVSSIIIAALIGALCALPVAVLVVAAARNFLSWWPALLDGALLAKPFSATIGLLCHRVIGRKLIEIAERKAEEVAK